MGKILDTVMGFAKNFEPSPENLEMTPEKLELPRFNYPEVPLTYI